jgi:multidrug resistance efflux pump
MATTSAEAVVNSRLITVRAPISGNILASASLEPGMAFRAGATLLSVKNPNLDRSNLDNLNRTVETLSIDVASLRAKAAVLKHHKTELVAQVQQFRDGRIETLERAVNALSAQIAAAVAQHDEAAKVLARARILFDKKVTTEANFDSALRDESVAAQNVSRLEQQRQAAEIELAAARQGTFIADGYNDIPQAEQRSLDVELQLADVEARLSGTVKELAAAKQAAAQEDERTQALSLAAIRPNVSGRIWEMMTAPGEHVIAGQVLMRLLDCVSESVFEKLAIGQRATFKPRDGGPQLKGWVTNISGVASVASNDAIQPKLLTREPYHVTLEFPGLVRQTECQVSRAGLVTLGKASAVESAPLRLGNLK